MLAVIILLGVIAGLTAGGTYLLSPDRQAPVARAGAVPQVAPLTLPAPTQRPPRQRVEAAHRALHALGRACKSPSNEPDGARVRRPLDVIERFAKDYPGGGFSMDDEPGTTLALLVVVWDSLKACDASLIPEVQRLIPPQYRGD